MTPDVVTVYRPGQPPEARPDLTLEDVERIVGGVWRSTYVQDDAGDCGLLLVGRYAGSVRCLTPEDLATVEGPAVYVPESCIDGDGVLLLGSGFGIPLAAAPAPPDLAAQLAEAQARIAELTECVARRDEQMAALFALMEHSESALRAMMRGDVEAASAAMLLLNEADAAARKLAFK